MTLKLFIEILVFWAFFVMGLCAIIAQMKHKG